MKVLITHAQSRLRVLWASKRQAFPSPGLFVLRPFCPPAFLSVYHSVSPAMCSSSAAASASNGMRETAAYQLAPLFHTQHYVPFVRWNEQPFLKTTGTIVIIYYITSFL